jgi:hypothetical protein
MEHENELRKILQETFKWNKSRLNCLIKFIFAVILSCTVSLPRPGTIFSNSAKIDSNIKRMKRFLRWLPRVRNYQYLLAIFVLKLIPYNKFVLSIDRTNWKFGKLHINLLVLGVWYEGVAIPLFWVNIGKAGNSKTPLRIAAMKKLLEIIPPDRIEIFLADREFIGREWFDFLLKSKIPFSIRIKSNHQVQIKRKKYYQILEVKKIFSDLKKTKFIENCILFDCELSLAGCYSSTGELVVVATNINPKKALEMYRLRWSIECFFSCLKTRGFNFEDTHITNIGSIEALVFILSIATFRSIKLGVQSIKDKPREIAKHGRARQSLFRIGLDKIRRCIAHVDKMINEMLSYIKILSINTC